MRENIPNHVAIIPDGNRRWAKARNLKPWEGHEAGAKNLGKLVSFALKKGIHCLSFWGSSLDNLKKRPMAEKKALLEIYARYFEKLAQSKEIHDEKVKINVIGRWKEQFPTPLLGLIDEVIDKTKSYKKKILNLMLAYDGIDDMLTAIRSISGRHGATGPINEKTIKVNLMTAAIPSVDYLIRTGGEPHLSAGFMMWDIADAQLYFSELNFPDFGDEAFGEALEEYARRGRRFGR